MRRSLNLLLILGIIGCSMAGRHDPTPGSKAKPLSAAPTSSTTNGPVPAPTGPGVMEITPENSKITFVGSIPRTSHPGGFNQFHGTIELPPGADLSTAKIAVEIDMTSTWTHILPLTMHLKGADFFDVKTYPRAGFVSTKIEPSPGQGASHLITGAFTLHGVTKTITVPASIISAEGSLTLDCTFTIRQSEFGMAEAARKTNDEVPVTVAIRVPRT
jgi:polyisoprenoid-binding protein YceI